MGSHSSEYVSKRSNGVNDELSLLQYLLQTPTTLTDELRKSKLRKQDYKLCSSSSSISAPAANTSIVQNLENSFTPTLSTRQIPSATLENFVNNDALLSQISLASGAPPIPN